MMIVYTIFIEKEDTLISIEFKQVEKTFRGLDGPVKAIDGIHLSIKTNELFGVIGESGAGKSTLMRFINALEKPDHGQVLVDGIEVNTLKKKDLRQHQQQIGMIFQQFNLLNNKTVGDNVHLPLELSKHENALSVDEVLAFVGLTDKKHHYPTQLSGGQKQRVGIARALITQPKILLCDEPTSALDQNTTEEIVGVLKKVHQEFGMTLLIVTHELPVIKALCERSAIMEHGKLIDVVRVTKSGKRKEERPYHERALEVLTHEE